MVAMTDYIFHDMNKGEIELANKFLTLFESRKFENWYKGNLESYLTGDMAFENGLTPEQSREVMLQQIHKLIKR